MDDWKKELKSRFDDFQIGEPEGLWDSIEKDIPYKKRKVIPAWWIAGVAVAAAAALAIFVVPTGRKSDDLSNPVAVMEITSTTSDSSPLLAENHPLPDEIISPKTIAELVYPHPSKQYQDIPSEPISKEPEAPQTPIKQTQEYSVKKEVNSTYSFDDFDKPEETVSNKKHTISYKVSTSASSPSTSSTTGYGMAVLETRSDLSGGSLSKMKNLLTTNRETEKTVNHRMPVRISFDIVYSITEHFSIGTGLSRTSLSSTFHSGTSTVFTDSEQKMVLIGIPLFVKYEIPLSGGQFGLYASIGGMWEKAVEYSLDSYDYIGGKINSKQAFSGPVPDYDQWSVNAVAGGHIRLSRNSHWSVFAEAGASRHFDNKSDISTIYNDKPLMPLVNFGLRYSITN